MGCIFNLQMHHWGHGYENTCSTLAVLLMGWQGQALEELQMRVKKHHGFGTSLRSQDKGVCLDLHPDQCQEVLTLLSVSLNSDFCLSELCLWELQLVLLAAEAPGHSHHCVPSPGHDDAIHLPGSLLYISNHRCFGFCSLSYMFGIFSFYVPGVITPHTF